MDIFTKTGRQRFLIVDFPNVQRINYDVNNYLNPHQLLQRSL